MARGHHHRPEEHPHHSHPMHEMKRARGGKIPGEEGHEMSYTAENNVEKEAEGEERKHGGKVKKERAHGGRAPKHHVEHHEAEHVEHHHYRRGGAPKKEVEMEGSKTKHRRLDRPGRKRGGGVGADMTPLSTAARTRQSEGHKAENDELSE